jgi:LAO/AO transport system kinase
VQQLPGKQESMADLAEQVLKGNRLALSRLITLIENYSPDHHTVLDQLFPHTGKAHIIGVTGPSGSGKSTLVNHLALNMVSGERGKSSHKIGIIAVDPTSPFTGGALLGDRVRMRDLTRHPDIFIRSMASRGALGGIARAADSAALVMDAAGFDIILIETVGAGQSEVEIARLAHTTIVVEAPGLGDDIQAAKAGILEIADVLVVNKSDKAAVDGTAQVLASMLAIGEELHAQHNENSHNIWQVPVILTSALNGDGVDELAAAVNAHRAFLRDSGEWELRSTARLKDLLECLVRDSLYDNWNDPANQVKMSKILRLVADHQRSPYQAVRDLIK